MTSFVHTTARVLQRRIYVLLHKYNANYSEKDRKSVLLIALRIMQLICPLHLCLYFYTFPSFRLTQDVRIKVYFIPCM